jgi:hypothetical protein
MSTKFICTALLLCLLLFANACSLKRSIPVVPVGPELDYPRALEVEKTIKAQSADLVPLRRLAEVQIAESHVSPDHLRDIKFVGTKGRKEQFRYAFVFSPPSSLRVEVLPKVAAYTLGIIVSKNAASTYLDNSEKTAYSGPVQRLLAKSFLNFPATEEDVASLLLGTIPKKFFSSPYKVFRDEKQGLTQFVNYNQTRVYTFREDKQDLKAKAQKISYKLERVELRDPFSGVVSLVAYFTEYGPGIGAKKIPSDIQLKFPSENIDMILSFTRSRYNEKIPDKTFTVTIPKSYSHTKL